MGIEETREKIVSVADKLFSRFGFQKTSMDEIARISRKAKGSLYYHFSSKEELFREVVQNEINHLKEKLNEILVNPDYNAGGKLKHYLQVRMEVLKEATNYHETIRSDFYESYEFIDDLRSGLEDWEKKKILAIITEGTENGEFEPHVSPEVLSDVLLMLLKGMEIPFYLQDKYEIYNPYFEDLSRLMLKGLRK